MGEVLFDGGVFAFDGDDPPGMAQLTGADSIDTSITWNEETGRYDWRTVLPDGREKSGTAHSTGEAQDLIRDWRNTCLPARTRAPRGLWSREEQA